ncbi:hypothetical protein E4U53_002695 [Claviceps sorghi]|nr:hypothetical protein E4U53_002695 [Claviceps sorghi]
MFTLRRFLSAVLAVPATVALAEVTATFNTRTTACTGEARASLQFRTTVKSATTLDRMVRYFVAWSDYRFTCERGESGQSYDIVTVYAFEDKNAALEGITEARSIVDAHKNEE